MFFLSRIDTFAAVILIIGYSALHFFVYYSFVHFFNVHKRLHKLFVSSIVSFFGLSFFLAFSNIVAYGINDA